MSTFIDILIEQSDPALKRFGSGGMKSERVDMDGLRWRHQSRITHNRKKAAISAAFLPFYSQVVPLSSDAGVDGTGRS